MPMWCKLILRLFAGFISVCSALFALFVPIASVLVFYDEPNLPPSPSIAHWLLGRFAFVLTIVAMVTSGTLISALFLRYTRYGRFKAKPKVSGAFPPDVISAQGLGF